jgi:hypothetical protein
LGMREESWRENGRIDWFVRSRGRVTPNPFLRGADNDN